MYQDFSLDSSSANNKAKNADNNGYYPAIVPSSAPPLPPPYSPPQSPVQEQCPPMPRPQAPPASREERFRTIVNKHEISAQFSSKLQKLNNFKIVFVFDDSGSMNTILEDSPLNSGLLKATRWDELKYFSHICIDIASIFNPDGVDIYFLNRPMARSVRSPEDLLPHMASAPNGYTPLSRVLGTVLNNNSPSFLGEKRLLVIIVTDGEPTDDNGKADISGFKQCLKSRAKTVHTTIVSCTDEDDTMSYLNNWDRALPRLDVVDDYRSEKNEILRVQGKHFRFTFGDYVVKSLLGSIDPSLDDLDEHKLAKKCVIL